MPDPDAWAKYLFDATSSVSAVATISSQEPGFDFDAAYAVQSQLVIRRVDAGEHLVGAKIDPLPPGVHDDRARTVFGLLTSAMRLEADEPLDCARLVSPMVEPEIAFVLHDALVGPGVTPQIVLSATEWIAAALEVTDSRFGDNESTTDVIANNASASRFLIGPASVAPTSIIDLGLVGCNLEAFGRVVATGAGAAAYGNPAAAVAAVANWLGKQGSRLEPGAVVLSGRLTDPIPIAPGGYVAATFAHLGAIVLRAI